MTSSGYEKLSSQDSSFLLFERESTPMHVSAVSIFENGPLTSEAGGLDIARIRKEIEFRLPSLPRYTKKLAFTPLAGDAIWLDDESFDLDHHVHHVALPRPGSESALRCLAGRLLSQALDRDYPLWEMWIVEGPSS